MADKTCYNCGVVGHLSRDYAMPKAAKPVGGGGGGGGFSGTCHNCGEVELDGTRTSPPPHSDTTHPTSTSLLSFTKTLDSIRKGI